MTMTRSNSTSATRAAPHPQAPQRLAPRHNRSGKATKARLIEAGEKLFASQGIDAVSLREITRTAGQANVSALQYHFTDRTGLLRAIVAKHTADTEPRRHALLDQYEGEDQQDLRTLVAALVLPLTAKLTDENGGREYLQIIRDVYTRPDLASIEELVPLGNPKHSMSRWHRLLDPLMPEEEKRVLHTRYPALRFAFVEYARRAAGPPRPDETLFTNHMIDLITALLTAPMSEATARIVQDRF